MDISISREKINLIKINLYKKYLLQFWILLNKKIIPY